ncbi:hypothetical protein Tco_0817409 [Tanacetum coccineum]
MEKLENENVPLEFQVQSLIKARENVKLKYQKLFDSIKKTWSQTQRELDELIENVNQKTYAYGDVRSQNQDLLIIISELKVRLKNVEKDVTSVKRSSSRGSSPKNSVFSNTKNQSEDVEVHVRTNKKTNVISQKNVVKTKKIVANVDVKNTLKAKDVLCVSYDKNVLTSCHDKCLAKYKLSMHSKVRRALFTTPRTARIKSIDTTPVVAKTSFAVVTPLSAKNKDSSASRSTSLFMQENTLSNYMRTKVKTSRKWQKWFEQQPNFGWSPKSITAKARPSVVKSRDNVVIQIVQWIVGSGCLKHMTDNLKLLKFFIKKFVGIVCFRNDHFAAITGYSDCVHGNVTICHVYYVEGFGHNLFSVAQFYDGDLEVAFRSKTCYVCNPKGDDLFTGARESNLYTISILDMVASSPVCLMSKATSTKSWLWH